VSPEEIAAMEQSLIEGGVPVEHVQKLCEVHVSVFESALKKQPPGKALPGHPAATYKEENRELKKILKLFKAEAAKTARSGEVKDLTIIFEQLKKVDIHYQRKENQLFPYLEEVDFTGPSKVMWGKHDEIREQIKTVSAMISDGNLRNLKSAAKELTTAMKRMIFMEERILLPTALRKLPDSTWARIRKGESSIGYAWITPGNLWDADIILAASPQPIPFRPTSREPIPSQSSSAKNGQPAPAAIGPDALVGLDVGELTVSQINLMLKHLPLDITYVDEHDAVRYFSEGKERHFPRSPGIIGRSVQNCHPPKSVHIVEKIVASFKNREKSHADFWLKMGEKLIYIRYFAVFDDQDMYRGVLEVTQEISEIQSLEGERKLLDW
jgi:uncharacterized protein